MTGTCICKIVPSKALCNADQSTIPAFFRANQGKAPIQVMSMHFDKPNFARTVLIAIASVCKISLIQGLNADRSNLKLSHAGLNDLGHANPADGKDCIDRCSGGEEE